MTELVSRLRKVSAGGLDEYGVHCDIELEAADALEAKDKELERLRAALELARDRYVEHAATGAADGSTARDMFFVVCEALKA